MTEPIHASSAVVLSFDVEEHDRIEAARSLRLTPCQRAEYAARMEDHTCRLLDLLAEAEVRATFYIVGAIARSHPRLVRRIAAAGHEIGSHSWEHHRVVGFTPEAFRRDLRQSKDALEQVSGTAVVGFRAPTFSILRSTAWAIDILAEEGFFYDSSIYPVWHDRYGIPDAPRGPFWVHGEHARLLELPPATWRVAGLQLPVGGGGYFRLFPLAVIEAGIRQMRRAVSPPVIMLYFHPWEFDAEQPRLPLGRLARWRTYVGTGKTTTRLRQLLQRSYRFCRAVDVAQACYRNIPSLLPEFRLEISSEEPRKAASTLLRDSR